MNRIIVQAVFSLILGPLAFAHTQPNTHVPDPQPSASVEELAKISIVNSRV